MGWTRPKYSKSLVDKAGRCLASPEKYAWDRRDLSPFDVIGNFRSAHGYALNNYQVILRGVSSRTAKHFIVAQRLKRIPSIIAKLVDRPGLRLTQIQDVGGCRSIVDSIDSLRAIQSKITGGRLRPKLMTTDDYVNSPKEDGYRSLHLVFIYYKPAGSPFNNQRIEVQLRSPLQHAWATAVETVDMFNRYRLKSGEGPEEWKRFFCLVGSAFALQEDSPLVPGFDWSRTRLQEHLRECLSGLNIYRKLAGYQVGVKHMDRVAAGRAPGFVLIRLNFKENMLHARHYARSENERMNAEYIEAEKAAFENKVEEVALVATERVDELKRAYPNYYMDTQRFVSALRRFVG